MCLALENVFAGHFIKSRAQNIWSDYQTGSESNIRPWEHARDAGERMFHGSSVCPVLLGRKIFAVPPGHHFVCLALEKLFAGHFIGNRAQDTWSDYQTGLESNIRLWEHARDAGERVFHSSSVCPVLLGRKIFAVPPGHCFMCLALEKLFAGHSIGNRVQNVCFDYQTGLESNIRPWEHARDAGERIFCGTSVCPVLLGRKIFAVPPGHCFMCLALEKVFAGHFIKSRVQNVCFDYQTGPESNIRPWKHARDAGERIFHGSSIYPVLLGRKIFVVPPDHCLMCFASEKLFAGHFIGSRVQNVCSDYQTGPESNIRLWEHAKDAGERVFHSSSVCPVLLGRKNFAAPPGHCFVCLASEKLSADYFIGIRAQNAWSNYQTGPKSNIRPWEHGFVPMGPLLARSGLVPGAPSWP